MLDRTCSVEDCGSPVWARGWCSVHYGKAYRSGNLLSGSTTRRSPLESFVPWFWSQFVPGPNGCRDWALSPDSKGYGQVHMETSSGRSTQRAHVLAWLLTNGPIPDGLFVLHHCDRRICGNPDHLFLGTHDDNMADMIAKDRNAHGTRNGHAKLTGPQVLGILLRLDGGEPHASIAARYAIDQSVISKINTGKRWRAFTATVVW